MFPRAVITLKPAKRHSTAPRSTDCQPGTLSMSAGMCGQIAITNLTVRRNDISSTHARARGVVWAYSEKSSEVPNINTISRFSEANNRRNRRPFAIAVAIRARRKIQSNFMPVKQVTAPMINSLKFPPVDCPSVARAIVPGAKTTRAVPTQRAIIMAICPRLTSRLFKIQ